MSSRTLSIALNGYWHCGSGRSSGAHLDALTEKDHAGLPYVPGRHLKGLLRHAVHRAEHWGWLDKAALPKGPAESFESLLFGRRSRQKNDRAQAAENDSTTTSGMLLVEDALLPPAEYDYLSQPQQKPLLRHLFRDLYSTAIGPHGTAKAQSLRGMEVALPVTVRASLTLIVTALDDDLRAQQQAYLAQPAAWEALERSLPLIDAIGASRSRGLGEAILSLSAA